MNTQDYVTIGVIAFNLLFNMIQGMRHRRLTKASIEKALYSNRQALGKLLSNIVQEFTHQNISAEVDAVTNLSMTAPVIPVSIPNTTSSNVVFESAHSQAGAPNE